MSQTSPKLGRWSRFCGWLLRRLGWTAVEPMPEESKCIMLGVPHTSIWDFAISYLYYKSLGGSALFMVKKGMFVPPLSWLLRALGAVPVDRKNPTQLIHSIVNQMNTREVFHLALAPEGTRKPIRRWKTGYHLIARAAGVPVYLGYFDWKTKRIGRGLKVELTDDAAADTRRIQEIYEQMHLTAKFPENYLTH